MSVCLDESLRVENELSRHGGDGLSGPGDVGDGARAGSARAERSGVLVARADHHLAVRREPKSLGRVGAHAADDLVRGADPGQLARFDPGGLEHRLGPVAQSNVV